MKTSPLVLVGAVSLLGLTAACSTAAKKPVYDASQTGRILHEERGEVVAVREVTITPPELGVLRGGGTGRRVGSAVGAGILTGDVTRAAAGIGAAIGGDIGAKLDDKDGEEITIRLRTDEVVVVVQERGEQPMMPGDKIKVLTASSAPRSTGILGILGSGSASGPVKVVREDNFRANAIRFPRERALSSVDGAELPFR